MFGIRFYSDYRGTEPVLAYLQRTRRDGDLSAAAAFERAVDRLAVEGTALSTAYSRIIDRRLRLYELRFGNHRVAYFEHGGELVLLHGWRKRTRKLDTGELELGRQRALDWASRA